MVIKQELLLTPEEIKQELEKIFASVVSLSPAEHKNVMGGKWKFIDAVAEWVEVQLAKSQEVCPECKGHRRQGYYESDDGNLHIKICSTCQGTGKAKVHRDRPDREKICITMKPYCAAVYNNHCKSSMDNDCCRDCVKKADQILALFDEKEIRKQ